MDILHLPTLPDPEIRNGQHCYHSAAFDKMKNTYIFQAWAGPTIPADGHCLFFEANSWHEASLLWFAYLTQNPSARLVALPSVTS